MGQATARSLAVERQRDRRRLDDDVLSAETGDKRGADACGGQLGPLLDERLLEQSHRAARTTRAPAQA
jgi:hypothetical protein